MGATTRRTPAAMSAAVQGGVRPVCACGSVSGLFEGDGLGVADELVEIKALADNFAPRIDNHAADQRARTDLPAPARGQFEGARHHALVEVQSSGFKVQS
jgi:hypothetical protein